MTSWLQLAWAWAQTHWQPTLIGLGIFLLVWNVVPLLYVLLCRKELTWAQRLDCCACLFAAGMRSLICLPASFSAPLVVPIALIFTKWEDNELPALFRWWDNDVSINGDRPEYWPLDYVGTTYYANAHPRSRWARWLWLGTRNRASWLAQWLGYEWKPGDQETRQTWGDPLTGRDHEGWTINYAAGIWQLYRVQRFGPICVRTNFGYKIWNGYDQRAKAMVINITFTLIGWQGD
jgi:hypothetical protein